MSNLRICTAFRDKDFEDKVNTHIQDLGFSYSTVNSDDIVNAARTEELVFVIEDSYSSILDSIEEQNAHQHNFIPVIFVTAPDSKYKTWISNVKYPEKYFTLEMKLVFYLIKTPFISPFIKIGIERKYGPDLWQLSSYQV